jgi:hypothetical protein
MDRLMLKRYGLEELVVAYLNDLFRDSLGETAKPQTTSVETARYPTETRTAHLSISLPLHNTATNCMKQRQKASHFDQVLLHNLEIFWNTLYYL